jgi:hypothetical protein
MQIVIDLPKSVIEHLKDGSFGARIEDRAALIDAVMSGIPLPEWIPVSERLPEKSGKYLVTVKNGNVYAGTYDAFSGKFQCAATAWRPLPTPYKESEE